LDLVEIFLEVEKDFFLEFDDDTVKKFKTIGDAVEYVSNWRFADTY
jgi:acyl carrier protein